MPKYNGNINPISGPYNVPTGSNIIAAGKYGRVVVPAAAPFECTGSNGGVIAILNTSTTAAYTLIGGGSASGLLANTIHEISPRTVTNLGGGTVYLYYRN